MEAKLEGARPCVCCEIEEEGKGWGMWKQGSLRGSE